MWAAAETWAKFINNGYDLANGHSITAAGTWPINDQMYRLRCGLNSANKQSFCTLSLSLGFGPQLLAKAETVLLPLILLDSNKFIRLPLKSTHNTIQNGIQCERREREKSNVRWRKSGKVAGGNGHVIRKNKIHLLVKVLCFVFMLFIIDFSASFRLLFSQLLS